MVRLSKGKEDSMDVKITQIESTHNNVRTKTIEGKCQHLPEVGYCFAMMAEPLDPSKMFRHFVTTPVKSVVIKDIRSKEGHVYLFETQNSRYELRLM
jgi:hypothetical protein